MAYLYRFMLSFHFHVWDTFLSPTHLHGLARISQNSHSLLDKSRQNIAFTALVLVSTIGGS